MWEEVKARDVREKGEEIGVGQENASLERGVAKSAGEIGDAIQKLDICSFENIYSGDVEANQDS